MKVYQTKVFKGHPSERVVLQEKLASTPDKALALHGMLYDELCKEGEPSKGRADGYSEFWNKKGHVYTLTTWAVEFE